MYALTNAFDDYRLRDARKPGSPTGDEAREYLEAGLRLAFLDLLNGGDSLVKLIPGLPVENGYPHRVDLTSLTPSQYDRMVKMCAYWFASAVHRACPTNAVIQAATRAEKCDAASVEKILRGVPLPKGLPKGSAGQGVAPDAPPNPMWTAPVPISIKGLLLREEPDEDDIRLAETWLAGSGIGEDDAFVDAIVEDDVAKAYVGFSKLKKKLAARRGVKNAGALAAFVGRKKYGSKKMQAAAARGKKLRGARPKKSWDGTDAEVVKADLASTFDPVTPLASLLVKAAVEQFAGVSDLNTDDAMMGALARKGALGREWVERAEVRELCPACAVEMERKGLAAVSTDALRRSLDASLGREGADFWKGVVAALGNDVIKGRIEAVLTLKGAAGGHAAGRAALAAWVSKMKREGGEHPFRYCYGKMAKNLGDDAARRFCARVHLEAFGQTPAQRAVRA